MSEGSWEGCGGADLGGVVGVEFDHYSALRDVSEKFVPVEYSSEPLWSPVLCWLSS